MPPATTPKPRRPVNIAKFGSSNGSDALPWVSRCQTMSDDGPSTGITLRIHEASNSTSKPWRDRSSVLKLSLTAQRPGRFDFSRMSTVLRCSATAASSGASVTALG